MTWVREMKLMKMEMVDEVEEEAEVGDSSGDIGQGM